MHTVFVSSTYLDLEKERAEVRDAILRLQLQYSGMEYFGSDPERPKKVSLGFASRATVYIGIVAHRYGTVDAETGKSLTQLEYETARLAGRPTLIYFKSPSARIEPTSQYIDFDLEYRKKLNLFKEILSKDCVVQWFLDAKDLAAKVTADLANLMLRTLKELQREELPSREEFDLYGVNDSDAETSMPIPMIGPKGVGKTVYGCMLSHEPAANLCRRGLTLEMNENSSRLFDYYNDMSRGNWASATLPGCHRGVEFSFCQKKLFRHRRHRLRLVDASGEEWWTLSNPEYYSGKPRETNSPLPQLLSACSGLVLFFQVKEDKFGDSYLIEDLDELYANIIGALAHGEPTGVLEKPVAIVLTKCDLMPALLEKPSSAADYLIRSYPLASAQILYRLKNFAVFPTSSVGQVDETGKPIKLEPKGLWEPMLWLFDSFR